MFLGMLEFLLFNESTEVKKNASLINGWLKECVEATEMIEGQDLGVRIKGWRKEEVFVMHFFGSGITQDVSFLLFL